MLSAFVPTALAIPKTQHKSMSSIGTLTSLLELRPTSISTRTANVFQLSLTIRMGGGPRTFPGGVSKWQWKRMQAKKSKQLLKARLARERQIYEMRKRAELKEAVSELERPWEVIERAPTLFSVKADEQVKVLADRFQKPGGFDMWSEKDGPQVFRAPDGLPSARFFPKGVVHSVRPYGIITDAEEGLDRKGSEGDLQFEGWITRSKGLSRGNSRKTMMTTKEIRQVEDFVTISSKTDEEGTSAPDNDGYDTGADLREMGGASPDDEVSSHLSSTHSRFSTKFRAERSSEGDGRSIPRDGVANQRISKREKGTNGSGFRSSSSQRNRRGLGSPNMSAADPNQRSSHREERGKMTRGHNVRDGQAYTGAQKSRDRGERGQIVYKYNGSGRRTNDGQQGFGRGERGRMSHRFNGRGSQVDIKKVPLQQKDPQSRNHYNVDPQSRNHYNVNTSEWDEADLRAL